MARAKFRNPFFDGANYYPAGIQEVPDTINGKPVYFADDPNIPRDNDGNPKDAFVLPPSAVRTDAAPAAPVVDKPIALSEMGQANAKPNSFVEAMADKK